MLPMGRQCASGLSLLLSAIRFFTTSAAHGCSGRPSLNPAPTSRNVATGGVPGGGGGGGGGGAGVAAAPCAPCPRCPAGGLMLDQIPEKSGFPSAVLGGGPLRFGFPSGPLG